MRGLLVVALALCAGCQIFERRLRAPANDQATVLLVSGGLGRPIEKIARDVGFGSAETMCRSFVKAFGRTPQELRRSARKHPGS
ncbi:MAG: helix-turn-helix transcriptional regulator, partial [Kofleriaceae bacterium]